MKWSGNTGKAKIQADLLAITEPVSIIDVGIVGTGPLDLWRYMPIDRLPLTVVGVDSNRTAVERARKLGLPIELHAISGYELSRHFASETFDIAICTQLLEHVARPVDLLTEVFRVVKVGGWLWLTVDSAHFATSHHGDPTWKRWIRPMAAIVSERYHDFGLTEASLRSVLTTAGFEPANVMHCNLGPLKPLFASLAGPDQEVFMPAWLDFEEALSQRAFSDRSLFRAIYAAARRT